MIRRLIARIRAKIRPAGGEMKPLPAPSSVSPSDGAVVTDRAWTPGSPDLLGRRPFADRLAETLYHLPADSGVVVGLFGSWGSGKSSVLEMVKDRLQTRPDVQVLEFNPWYFKGQDALVLSFFGQLSAALGSQLGTKQDEFKGVLNKYGTLLSGIPVSAFGFDPGKAMQAIASQLGNDSIEMLRSQLDSILKRASVRVVVIVDDLDRLDRQELHVVLKLVKLVGDLSGVSYLLALDDEMVAAAIASEYGGSIEAGRSFLEKIVQVPIRLPRTDSATQLHLALGEIDRALGTSGVSLNEDDIASFRLSFDALYGAQDRTLRTVRRLGNALTFSLPLLRNEVNSRDLLLVEALRVLLPHVHQSLPRFRTILLDGGRHFGGKLDDAGRDAARASWRDLLDIAPISDRDSLAELLTALFPRVQTFTTNYSYDISQGDSLAREKRIASEDYFERYFLYSVSIDDFSDARIDSIATTLEQGDGASALAQIAEMLTPRNAGTVVRKLRYRQSTLSPIGNGALAQAFVELASKLPRPVQVFDFDTPFGQAMIGASQALRGTDQSRRGQLALGLVSPPIPLHVAGAFYQKIRTIPGETRGASRRERILTEGQEGAVRAVMGERLSEAMNAEPFYLPVWGEDGRLLIFLWHLTRGKEESTAFLAARFRRNDREALAFLASQARKPTNALTGRILPMEFGRESYNAAIEFIPADQLASAVKTALTGEREPSGSDSDEPDEIPESDDVDPLVRLGFRFLSLHQPVAKEEEPTPPRP